MIIVIAAIVVALACYLMGFWIGKRYAEEEIQSRREEMGIENELDRT